MMCLQNAIVFNFYACDVFSHTDVFGGVFALFTVFVDSDSDVLHTIEKQK